MVVWRKFRIFSFIIALLPLVYLVIAVKYSLIRGNVIEQITHFSGHWSLFFLTLTLMVTPISNLFPIIEVRTMRRQWGLFSAFYAFVHIFIYTFLDFQLEWLEIYYDIIENNYLIVGIMAIIIFCILTFTSTQKLQRTLRKYWKKIHQTIYLLVVLVVLHFFLLVKADLVEPFIYASSMALLILLRFKVARNFLLRI